MVMSEAWSIPPGARTTVNKPHLFFVSHRPIVSCFYLLRPSPIPLVIFHLLPPLPPSLSYLVSDHMAPPLMGDKLVREGREVRERRGREG